MVEAIAETDDQMLERYLSGEEVTNEELKLALRRATIANRLQPVSAAAPSRTRAVQPLLDAVVDYLPSPVDIPPIQGSTRTAKSRSSASRPTTSRSRASSSRS